MDEMVSVSRQVSDIPSIHEVFNDDFIYLLKQYSRNCVGDNRRNTHTNKTGDHKAVVE